MDYKKMLEALILLEKNNIGLEFIEKNINNPRLILKMIEKLKKVSIDIRSRVDPDRKIDMYTIEEVFGKEMYKTG